MVLKDWFFLTKNQSFIYFAQKKKNKIGNMVKSTNRIQKEIELIL